jgi:hypothetical protein
MGKSRDDDKKQGGGRRGKFCRCGELSEEGQDQGKYETECVHVAG